MNNLSIWEGEIILMDKSSPNINSSAFGHCVIDSRRFNFPLAVIFKTSNVV